MKTLRWFEENDEGEIVEHPPVDLKRALAIAGKSYAAAGPGCPVFGLMYDRDTYLEFFMEAPDSVGMQCEVAAKDRPKRGLFARFFSPDRCGEEKTLKSWTEIEENISAYFNDGPGFLYATTGKPARS